MEIYERVGATQQLATANTYRLEGTDTEPRLRIYVCGKATDAVVQVEKAKGISHYARLAMSQEDRAKLNKFFDHVH